LTPWVGQFTSQPENQWRKHFKNIFLKGELNRHAG
jgi:hypothetical protein